MKMEKNKHWIYKTMNEIRFLKKRYTKFLVMVEFRIRTLICR